MKLALIGENVSQSKSKYIHEHLIDCAYDLLSIKSVHENLSMLKGYNGFNVTIPFKEDILPYLDYCSEEVESVKSCNTVFVNIGKLYGYNTDIYGFEKSLENFCDVSGKKVLVLGSGGAAKSVLFVLDKLGASIDVFNRTRENAEMAIRKLRINAKVCEKEVCFSKKYDIIVNTTSVGMRDEETPYLITAENVPHYVIDIICKDTPLLQSARAFGSSTKNGFSMLVYQAAKADEIFSGKRIDFEMVQAVIEELL